jgi:hypothetical protein
MESRTTSFPGAAGRRLSRCTPVIARCVDLLDHCRVGADNRCTKEYDIQLSGDPMR